jgi:hypothetical protein
MSGWSRPQGSSQSGGIDLLKIIPGYSGYRAKEGRRDEDKRVRTELARQYETIAQELGAQQGELVRAQRFAEIGSVERLERALRLFIDRLRTATYGYGGLFSDNPIDEHALDQIGAYDRALGDGIDQLHQQVSALGAAARGTGDLGEALNAVQQTIDDLNRRFDLRGQAIESGRPQATPTGAGAAPAAGPLPANADLHFGDTVSVSGASYAVQGRAEFNTGGAAWRQFQLRPASGMGEQWLHTPLGAQGQLALVHQVGEFPGPEQQVTVEGLTLTQSAAGPATAEVITEQSKQSNLQVNYRRFDGPNGAVLFAYDWGTERQTFVGRALNPSEIQVYSHQ